MCRAFYHIVFSEHHDLRIPTRVDQKTNLIKLAAAKLNFYVSRSIYPIDIFPFFAYFQWIQHCWLFSRAMAHSCDVFGWPCLALHSKLKKFISLWSPMNLNFFFCCIFCPFICLWFFCPSHISAWLSRPFISASCQFFSSFFLFIHSFIMFWFDWMVFPHTYIYICMYVDKIFVCNHVVFLNGLKLFGFSGEWTGRIRINHT